MPRSIFAPLVSWPLLLGGLCGFVLDQLLPSSLPHSSILQLLPECPEILLLCEYGTVHDWISAQLEGRSGLDSARGSCPQPHLQGSNAHSQLCIAPNQGHLPLSYAASSLLKFDTPQLRN